MTVPGVELVLDARADLGEGPRWDARRQRLLWVDIMRGRVHASAPAGVPKDAGFPDGLTVDAEGFVWVALWGGAALRRYAPDGTLARVVPLPVTHPTSCAFGGPALDELFVTSARCELTPEERQRQPQAGGVFRLRPGVAGRPGHVFGMAA